MSHGHNTTTLGHHHGRPFHTVGVWNIAGLNQVGEVIAGGKRWSHSRLYWLQDHHNLVTLFDHTSVHTSWSTLSLAQSKRCCGLRSILRLILYHLLLISATRRPQMLVICRLYSSITRLILSSADHASRLSSTKLSSNVKSLVPKLSLVWASMLPNLHLYSHHRPDSSFDLLVFHHFWNF